MSINIRSQKGFGHIEVLLVLILISVIGFAGYYVYSQNKDTERTVSNTSSAEKTNQDAKPQLKKTYTNTEIGFGFNYPDNWNAVEDFESYDGGLLVGSVSVKSPSGVEVSFSLSAGKGGDCIKATTDKPHNTDNCNTLEVLSSEKVKISGAKDTYLYRYKFTQARDESGKAPNSEYGAYLSSAYAPDEYAEPLIGALYNVGNVEGLRDGTTLGTYLGGEDNMNPSFLQQADVKTAEQILKSLNFVK